MDTPKNITVTPHNGHRGLLRISGRAYACALGPAGVTDDKREGDGATPAGQFPLRAVWYRGDHIERPATGLPLREIQKHDGWCDAPQDPNYNSPVTLPYSASAERMWRDDDVYNLVVIIGHNDAPVVPGRGSAIFLHIANSDFGPTEGCVAVRRDDLIATICELTPGSMIEIQTD